MKNTLQFFNDNFNDYDATYGGGRIVAILGLDKSTEHIYKHGDYKKDLLVIVDYKGLQVRELLPRDTIVNLKPAK